MLEIEHTKIVSPFSIGKKRQIRRNHQGNEKIGIFSENGGNMEKVAKNISLKGKRLRHKLTLTDLAFAVNTSASHLSRIESGETMLTANMAERLDHVYGDKESTEILQTILEDREKLKMIKEIDEILTSNSYKMSRLAIQTIDSFMRFVFNMSPELPDFVKETSLPEPVLTKQSPSGSWTWVKRELNTELKVLGIPINRVHISRSMAVDMGTSKIWNTETEMFTSFLDPDPEQMLSTVTPITKDLLELAPNGGVVHWDAINKLREDKHIPSNTLVNHFLFGNDQIVFVPLENLENRKVFLSVAGPSFDYDEYELIRATAMNFMSRYM